jgi:hypothetical protein
VKPKKKLYERSVLVLLPFPIITFTSHAPQQTLVLYKSAFVFLDESSFAVGLHLSVVLVSTLPEVLPVGSAAETSLERSAGEIDEKVGGERAGRMVDRRKE